MPAQVRSLRWNITNTNPVDIKLLLRNVSAIHGLSLRLDSVWSAGKYVMSGRELALHSARRPSAQGELPAGGAAGGGGSEGDAPEEIMTIRAGHTAVFVFELFTVKEEKGTGPGRRPQRPLVHSPSIHPSGAVPPNSGRRWCARTGAFTFETQFEVFTLKVHYRSLQGALRDAPPAIGRVRRRTRPRLPPACGAGAGLGSPRPAPITLLDSEARLPEAQRCVGMLTFQPTTIAFDPSFPGRILSQVRPRGSRAGPLAACV